MGAPSNSHESRVEELRTLASLAGFTVDVSLPWRLRPDVARICLSTARLFIGDAKATESARCEATRRRLRWYGVALASLPPTTDPIIVALAVPAGTTTVAWEQALVSAVGVRMVCEVPTATVLGDSVIIATRADHPRVDRPYPYRARLWPVTSNDARFAP